MCTETCRPMMTDTDDQYTYIESGLSKTRSPSGKVIFDDDMSGVPSMFASAVKKKPAKMTGSLSARV